MQTHNSFSLRSRASRKSPECLQSSQRWCHGASAEVAVQCCISFSAVTLLPPMGASALLKENFKSKESSTSDGRLFKDTSLKASRSCVSGCGHFLASPDGHDRCPSCLGFRHAEAALVDESCSHCGNMTMAMLRSRYLLARRGGIPLALPRSSSSELRRTTSAQGQGDLRITVRASPSSTSLRGPLTPLAHRTVWCSRMSVQGPRTGRSTSR